MTHANLAAIAGAFALLSAGAATAQSGGEWTGFYAGGSLATAAASAYYCDFGGGDIFDCDDPDQDLMPNPSPEGGMFGLTAGYDWSNGALVYGVAGDILFGDLSDIAASTVDYGCVAGCGLDVSQIAMLRGRVGYAMGDFLPYATAGLAVTRVTVFSPGFGSAEGTFNNVVIGLGGDYRLTPTLSAGLDLLHLVEATGNPVINSGFCPDCGAASFSATILRATLAYRF